MSGYPGSDPVGKNWAIILKDAAARLEAVGIANPMGDARRLFAHGLGIDASRVTLAIGDVAQNNDIARFQDLIEKRLARQPVSQLIGFREFFGRQFAVTSDVLDPRPDTETLVEQALGVPFDTVLDLGSGSGCILISLLCERLKAKGVGVDCSGPAVALADQNAQKLSVSDRAVFAVSNWFDLVDGQFGLIVSNPPYVTEKEYTELEPELRQWEPKQALTPGGDGLDAYRAIIAGAPAHLRPGGRLMVEIGQSQGEDVSQMYEQAGFTHIRLVPDIDGRDRVVLGAHTGNNPP